jgi:UDP-3-O-[3-hydroxymyristoyl] glucosamine N-acyltransferase
MIALTYKTAFPRFEYFLNSESTINETIFLDYVDGKLLLSDELIDRLRSETVIILIDNIHLNYTRIELYSKLRFAGVKFGNLISPMASIATTVKLGENVIIHHGVKIDGSTSLKSMIEIEENTVIKDHCKLGSGIYIGHQSFLGPNVQIGPNVNIGNHITICRDVVVGANVALEIDHQTIKEDIASGTFYGAPFPSLYRYI